MNVIDFPSVLSKGTVVIPADHAGVAVHPVEGMAGDLGCA